MSVISENVSYYHNVKYSSLQHLYRTRKMHGMKRVIVFCIFIVVLPAILIITPLYLRHSVFADIIYPVAESDIIEIRDGISSIFCEKHALHMNTTFNAFQLQSKPEISTNRKHIRLKKSMTLPDDTLEYWGFYLLKGAIVKLKVCSRYDGSRILLVKGDRNLKTCGLLEHNKNKFDAHYAGGYGVVNVTFEPIAEEIVSEENIKPQQEQQKQEKQQQKQQQSTLLPVLLKNQNDNHQNYESGAEKLLMMNNNNRQSRNNFETTNFNDNRGVDGGGGDGGDGRIQKRNRHHTMTSVKEIKIKKNADRNRFENFDRNDENHGGEDYSDDENDNDGDGGGGGDNDNSNISGNSSNKNVNINSNSLVNKLQLTKYENKFFNILESQNNNNNNNQKNIKINVKNNSGHNDANNIDKSSLISKLEKEFENLSNNSSSSNESINNNNTNSNERIFKYNDDNKRIRHKRYYHNKKQQQQQQQQQITQQKHHHHHHQHQYKNVKEEEEQQKHMKALQDEHYKRKKEIIKQLFDENNRLSKSKQYQIKNNPQQQQQNSQNRQNHPDDHTEHDKKQTLHLLNKRDTVYDAKIAHGGNALNFTDTESNSVSSFENSLLTCYDGQILLAKSFNPSSLCTSVHYLANSTHMIATHEIQEDGYYYYIFYSDNDLFRNDIHALFDIYKPTYQYTNITDSKGCVNETDCLFPIKFLSDEIVVVEVPTRDGIEHEEDDITYLISTCHPRMSVYIIFPISVLILILSCSFL